MKKIVTFTLVALSLFLNLGTLNAQSVSQGNFIIDPYYGAPNFGKTLANNFISPSTNYRVTGISGIGPAGVRLEYMLADQFGLGLDVIYNSTTVQIDYDSLNNDGSVFRTYTGSATMTRLRFQARFNYHFVQTEEVDAYVGVGTGTNTRIWSIKSNQPGYTFRNGITGTLLPISMRIAVGMRYYFSQNVGFNAEIGLGGPAISAGLSFKI